MSYTLLEIPSFKSSELLDTLSSLLLKKELLGLMNKEVETYKLYAVVDGAMDEEIDMNLEVYQASYVTLYPEAYSQAAGYAQPFLVEMDTSEEFARWFLSESYGNHKGIFFFSTAGMDHLSEVLGSFCIGYMQEGHKETFFRFYDPKIFPAFLRMVSADQLERLFGGQAVYVCENFITPQRLSLYRFDEENARLMQTTLDLTLPLDERVCKEETAYASMKPKAFYETPHQTLIFDRQDVAILSQSRLYLHAKRAALSLQVQHAPSKEEDFNTLYKVCFDLAHKGYALGLNDADANYLWIVANRLHEGIEKLKSHQKYGKIFDMSGTITQTQKAGLLEELVEALEEKLSMNKEQENG